MSISPAKIDLYQGQGLVSLTYDDGQRNNFENALPLHLEFDLPGGFAVISKRTQAANYWERYMRPWQVIEASQQGIEIYSHSATHVRLTELPDKALDAELKNSQDDLNALIGGETEHPKVTTLAIPFSAANERVIAAAKKYYSVIRIKEDRTTPVLPAESEDASLVYSFGLAKETTFDQVKKLIDQAVMEKSWLTLMFHGTTPEGAAQRHNDVDIALLRKTMRYIKTLGTDRILPVNLTDIQAIRKLAQSQGPGKPAP